VTDTVSIRDLRVSTVIGVYDWEREIEQTLVLSVDMAANVAAAAANDDLANTLDYSSIARAITAVVRDGKFKLIETVAERIAAHVLSAYAVRWVRVQVVKPLRDEGYSAAVTIERGAMQP